MNSTISSPVVVARILKAHGIAGEVVLESWTDVEGRLEKTSAFLLMQSGHPVREVRVESRRFFHGKHVFKFSEISTRSEAELLRGMELGVPEEELGTLPPDRFFIHDLVGMAVRTKDGTEIGKVCDVIKTGGVDLLAVGDKGKILIPFAAEICVEVNRDTRLIVIDPPEGLLELNAR